MDTGQRADERKASKPGDTKSTQNESEEELEPPSPIHISSEAALTPDFDFSDPHELRRIESDTQKRLKAILEVAGVTGLSQIDARTFQDPEILRKLTNSVSTALDEAATALTRMKSEKQTYEAFLRGANQAPSPTVAHPHPPLVNKPAVGKEQQAQAHPQQPLQQQQQQQVQQQLSAPQGANDSMQAVQRLLSQSHHGLQDATEDGESLLSLACSAGYYELAEVLLRMRASVEDRGIKGDSTPLMEAASGGYADIVKLLIDHGANVNAKSSVGNTALTYACCGGYEDVVRILLESAADVEHQNENGHTPLMEAASCGHVGVAKLLLEFGANINTHSNEFKESALTLACYKGHLEMVKFLLDAGADQEHKTDEMHTALMEASMDGHVEVARLLLDHGAQVNMPVDSFESPLTLAACGGHFQLADLLLSRGADLEEVNDEGYTPLMEASREGHEDVVKLLVERGANVNAQTEETQETALTLACCGGFLEVAQYLIEKGADIELGASSPLMEAAQEGHVDIVKFLIEKGTSIHAETNTQDTALTYACANGHTVIADILLQHGAELEHESEGGRTPLMKAARAGHLQTVQFLVSKGAGVNHRTATNDHSVLSLACAGGHVSVVQYLLMQGSDPAHILKDNSTMLVEAARGGHTAVASLILRQPKSSDVVVRSRVASVTKCGGGEEEPRTQEAAAHPATGQKFQGKVVLGKTYSDPGQRGGGAAEAETSSNLKQHVQQGTDVRPEVVAGGGGHEKQKVGLAKPNLPDAEASAQRHAEVASRDPASVQPPPPPPPQASGSGPHLQHSNQTDSVPTLRNNQHVKGEGGSAGVAGAPQGGEQGLTQSEIIIRNYMQQQQMEAAAAAGGHGNVTNKQPGGVGGASIAESAQALAQNIFALGNLKTTLASRVGGHHHHHPPEGAQPKTVVTQSSAQVAPTVLTGADLGKLPPAALDSVPVSLSVAVENYLAAISQGHVIPNLEELARSLVACERGDMTPGEEAALKLTLQRAAEGHSSLELDRAHKGQRAFPGALLQDCNFPINIPPPSDLISDHVPAMLPSGYMGSTLENDSYPTSEGEDEDEEEDEEEDLEEEEGSDSSYMAQDIASLPPGSYEPAIDIDQQTESNHDTALTLAAAGGHDELVELLLAHGSNIEHRDKKGCTPLILAASAGHAVTVAILLDHNADIEAQSERTKDTALSLACSGGRQEVVELLLAKGANFEHRNVSDYTPLSLAASGGYVNIIKLLLRAGADINSRTGSKLGISPLMLAAMNGHTSTVKLLLDMGSDISAQIETNRNTALTLACFQGRHEVVNLLVERQANVEHRAKTGLTPLMEAASGGYHEVGKVLIAKGADVNAAPVPSSRDTALTIAADKGHCKFVHLLLTHGAHVDVKNKKGNSPLWLACNGGHLDVVRLLVEHESGADVDSQDNRKVSCLMAAFRKGHSKVIKYLVDYVTQFPSDADLTRYINTLSDKELLKKCQRCMDVIIDAKERQAAEANKNATILLQELDLEKKHEEDRKAAAARKRAKKKRQKEKKAAQKGQTKDKSNSDNGEDDDCNDGDEGDMDRPPFNNTKYIAAESGIVVSVVDTTEQRKASPLTAAQGKERGKDKDKQPRVPLSNSVASLSVGSPLSLAGNGSVTVSPRKNKKDDGWKEVGRRTKKVVVPSAVFLQVIGKGSCNITAIKMATNTQIEVDKHNKHGSSRVLTIRGSADAIKQAHQYLSAIIEDPNRDLSQLLPKGVTKAMNSMGNRHPVNHELLSTQTVSEDMLPANDSSSTLTASVSTTAAATATFPSKAAAGKKAGSLPLGAAANARGAGSAHPASGKASSSSSSSKAARKGQVQQQVQSTAAIEMEPKPAVVLGSNNNTRTVGGGSGPSGGGGGSSATSNNKPAGMPAAARKLFVAPPMSAGVAVLAGVSNAAMASTMMAAVPLTSAASKGATTSVSSLSSSSSSGGKPSTTASATKPAAFAVPSAAKHPGVPRPTEAAKPKVVDVAGEVGTRAAKQPPPPLLPPTGVGVGVGGSSSGPSVSVPTYSSVIGSQVESRPLSPPNPLPLPSPLPPAPQVAAIEQPLQQLLKTPTIFQEPAQFTKPKKKSTYSDAVGKKPAPPPSDPGSWANVAPGQFGAPGLPPADSAGQGMQAKVNLAPGAKPIVSDLAEKSPSFEKQQHKQNPWNEVVDYPMDEGLTAGLGPIGPPPGRTPRPGPSFSPGLPSSKTSPPTTSGFSNPPYRNDTSPALKSPLLGPVPPALLPGPEKGLYSSAFQPIQPADVPTGDQGSGAVVTHVPTPVRNPRPPLLATPPGFNPTSFVQAESNSKNASSPNKSPPHPTGKGFNPNAPSFVPTQQVISSSSRQGPSNPPTSSILGNPPVFPTTAGFVASGVGSSLLGSAPASMYGSYRLLPGTTNFGSPQVQPSLYQQQQQQQQPSLLGNPPPLNQAPLNPPPLLGHPAPAVAPLTIPVRQGQMAAAYTQSYDGALAASGVMISTSSPVSFPIGSLRSSSTAPPDLHAQSAPGYKDPYAMEPAMLPAATTTQSLLIQGPAPSPGSEFKYGLPLGYPVKAEQVAADYEVSSSHLPGALLGQFSINLGQLSALPHQMSPMPNCSPPEKSSPPGREEGTFAYGGPEVKYMSDGGVVADGLLPIGTERAKRSANYGGNSGFAVIAQGINPSKLWSFSSHSAASGDSDWSKAAVSSDQTDWPNLSSGTEQLSISPQDNLESVLEKLALTKYLQLFQSNEIDLDALLLMEEKDFSEIELPKGPRIKLLNALGRKPLDDIESASNPNLSSPTSEGQSDHLDNSQPVLSGVHHKQS